MHQSSSNLPIPAPATGAMSTEGPQQLTGLQMSQTAPQISFLHIQLCTPRLFKHMLKCKTCKHICNICPGTRQEAAIERCRPPRRGFLGKPGDKGLEAPFGESQRSRKSQVTAKVSKTGRGFRALSSVPSPAWDMSVSSSRSDATAKAVPLFQFWLLQIFHNPILSKRSFWFFLQHASFFIRPPSGTIHFLHESQLGGVSKRERSGITTLFNRHLLGSLVKQLQAKGHIMPCSATVASAHEFKTPRPTAQPRPQLLWEHSLGERSWGSSDPGTTASTALRSGWSPVRFLEDSASSVFL